MVYLHVGAGAGYWAQGSVLTSPGFLRLLLTLGITVVARRMFSESVAKVVIISFEFLAWVYIDWYPFCPGRAYMSSR